LLRAILRETDTPRLRLSSLEPWDLDAEFFELWQDARLCRHLHLPLQSGCPATLRRMARKATPQAYRRLVAAARNVVPNAAITTDVIAGFPGETEAEFRASFDFVREMQFAGGHAFTYSPMPGTGAARMRAQVPIEVRRRRNHEYRDLFAQAARAHRLREVGHRRMVLWESCASDRDGSWRLGGLTDNYVRVIARAAEPRWNMIDAVELREEAGERLQGIIVKTG
jgi:threonylcarbamoyladenosine tRNA methylthiotransferase MtaB